MKWMQRRLLMRVERLEKDPCFRQPPPPSARDRLFRKKLRELLRKIDERYARMVTEDFKRGSFKLWTGPTLEFLIRVRDHVAEGRPLAFPAAVAEVYVGDPFAGNAAVCRQCRYKLPAAHFKQCPLCGGQVNS